MIKNRIYDLQTAAVRFVKKLRNKNRYGNLGSFFNQSFGNPDKLIEYNKSRVTGPEPCVCHAPFRSLYFDMNGYATACCFNRVHILGKYPENTIDEIVNGEKRSRLQMELYRQNFMYGCLHCHKLIEAANFEGVEARLYDGLKDQGTMPSEIVFELDNICNLECIMCHEGFSSSIAKRKGIAKSKYVYDSEFIRQLKPYLKKIIVAKFLGGEPLLTNIYYEIWNLILDINPKCKISLQTNGTVFNEKIKSYLNRGNFYIGISVDSLIKENFENIRKNADFNIVMHNIDEFRKIARLKGNFVNISVCPMPQNWKEIPNLVEYCNNKNVFIYFNTVYTSGFAISDLSEDKLLEILNYYKTINIPVRSYISKRNLKFFKDFVLNVEYWYHTKKQASPYTMRRHKWTGNIFKNFIINKINNDSISIDKLNNVFEGIINEFYFSDQDIENLNNLKSEDLITTLSNESVIELREMINRFIEFGKFSK
ncbi:MAG TPA: radical SAM protein [Bacteroidales bacterium]|nr:radical SAM protein [Bacteroidales bacterium]